MKKLLIVLSLTLCLFASGLLLAEESATEPAYSGEDCPPIPFEGCHLKRSRLPPLGAIATRALHIILLYGTRRCGQ